MRERETRKKNHKKPRFRNSVIRFNLQEPPLLALSQIAKGPRLSEPDPRQRADSLSAALRGYRLSATVLCLHCPLHHAACGDRDTVAIHSCISLPCGRRQREDRVSRSCPRTRAGVRERRERALKGQLDRVVPLANKRARACEWWQTTAEREKKKKKEWNGTITGWWFCLRQGTRVIDWSMRLAGPGARTRGAQIPTLGEQKRIENEAGPLSR